MYHIEFEKLIRLFPRKNRNFKFEPASFNFTEIAVWQNIKTPTQSSLFRQ